MDKEVSKNKAEAPAAANKGEGRRSRIDEFLSDVREHVGKATPEEFQEIHAAHRELGNVINAEANSRGVVVGIASPPVTDPSAGSVDGDFVCLRPMQGDREYSAGDGRTGKVGELAHLVTSGAIAAKDEATASAYSAFTGLETVVYSKPKAAEKEA
jgi:hypothetical protein